MSARVGLKEHPSEAESNLRVFDSINFQFLPDYVHFDKIPSDYNLFSRLISATSVHFRFQLATVSNILQFHNMI